MLSKLVTLAKNLEFFHERRLKDTAISETLGLMTYKEARAGELVIECGEEGDEFYLILEGDCEVLVPAGDSDEFGQADF